MMSEKRFQMMRRVDDIADVYDSLQDDVLNLSDVVALLNNLYDENEQLRQKNKQIGYLKRDLFILLNLIKDTNLEVNYDYKKIRERWE